MATPAPLLQPPLAESGPLFLDAQNQALELVVSGAPLARTLLHLASTVESLSGGAAVASIHLLDEQACLRNGASPSLPTDYLLAIDGIRACAGVGTCASAAATRQVVLTPDIATDAGWAAIKHLPLALGLVAAWSQPIIARDGRVLGTFGTYFRERRLPRSEERRIVEILSRTAALAIERALDEQRLRDSERAHRELAAQLQAADRRKDEFVAMLAHELRNPLAPIVQSIHLANEARATEAQKGWALRVIERQVRHMSVLLDDLLDVSRITRGHLELRRRAVLFKGIIESAVETARPLIDARAHSLEVHIDETDQPIVVDPDRISQVVSNLLTNAAKYTPQGGAIRLRCVRGDDGVELSVEDNGVGIDPRALHTVFEMFAQVEATRSMASGLGIGLALARAVVELHGGTLVASSEGVGKGSRFVMRLPRGPA